VGVPPWYLLETLVHPKILLGRRAGGLLYDGIDAFRIARRGATGVIIQFRLHPQVVPLAIRFAESNVRNNDGTAHAGKTARDLWRLRGMAEEWSRLAEAGKRALIGRVPDHASGLERLDETAHVVAGNGTTIGMPFAARADEVIQERILVVPVHGRGRNM